MTGPEAGTQFWQGAAGGIQLVVCIQLVFWPSNVRAEKIMVFFGAWNDYPNVIVIQGMLWNTADLQMILAQQVQKQL
jgi:hypothetical protein